MNEITRWRPEGWHNNETQTMIKDAMRNGHIAGIQGNTMFDIYEAGADAMLEALKNKTKNIDGCIAQAIDSLERGGRWVFIPDDDL